MKKNLQQFFKCDPRALFQYLIAVALIGFLFIQAFQYATTPEQHYIATVTEKKKIPTGGGGKTFRPLVVTRLADGEEHIFQVTDSPSHLRFASSKLYDSIDVGKTYTFRVYGYSDEAIEQYENILSV